MLTLWHLLAQEYRSYVGRRKSLTSRNRPLIAWEWQPRAFTWSGNSNTCLGFILPRRSLRLVIVRRNGRVDPNGSTKLPPYTITYDHTHWSTRDPVRSPIDKPVRARLVVGSVTTSESLVLYVFAPFCERCHSLPALTFAPYELHPWHNALYASGFHAVCSIPVALLYYPV
jgi:hypothetical protein